MTGSSTHRASPRHRGFTLVEMMVTLAIIGVLAAVAIPAFTRYLAKSKTSEARQFVKKIYEGARVYYMDSGNAPNSMQPIPKQFPASVGPTPATNACCQNGGKCEPNASQWNHPSWIALHFSVDDAHYYAYTYESSDVHRKFTARANGDLDCDGSYSTFELYGIVDSQYADGPAMSGVIYREQENE